ncbi:ABC-type glutathione transport system [Candidatus Methanoliparum sp. LAM-1]|nr:ABC-type glutathione transport system [Candidatus Methanoliparum sp. LAM-1]
MKVDNVSKEFSGIFVIKDVSLELKENDTFGFLGRCSSGKSVLMQCIKGVEGYEPTYGSIIYDVSYCPNCYWVDRPSMAGEPCPRCSTKLDFIELDYWDKLKEQDRVALSLFDRVSLMPQRGFTLYSYVSAKENLIKALESIGYPRDKMDERIFELISGFKLGSCLESIGRDLSGGEKQRIICATSLLKKPLLFLADEPTGTLDFVTAFSVHETMKKFIKREEITFIVTSHWPEAVKMLTDNAALVDDGKITKIGTSDEIYSIFMESIKPIKFERYKGGPPTIICKNLKKWYRGLIEGKMRYIKAVDDVSFDVRKDEILGIVGLSGAGKTSIAHMIIGISNITDGTIKIRIGDDWVDMSVPGPAGRGRVTPFMDILHQEYSLHEGEIVLENLISRIKKEISDEEKTKKAYNVLKMVNFNEEDIDYLLYKYPSELGEGERHKICIACALIKDPMIVILDEPTGTADPITRIDIAKSIRNARNSLKQTYLIISHDIDFIKTVCDRAIYLKNGKIFKTGDPDEVCDLMVDIESKES